MTSVRSSVQSGRLQLQLLDQCGLDPPVAQDLRRIGARARRGGRSARWRATEAWRRRGLSDAVDLDKGASGHVLGMLWRFVPVEYRRDAGVAAVEHGTPGIARAAREARGQQLAQPRPLVAPDRRDQGWVVDVQLLQQFGLELRLQRADRDVAAVGAGVGVVERRATVDQVLAAAIGPLAGRTHAVEQRRQQRGALGHGRIHHLSQAADARLVQRGEQAHGQHHRAAAVVGHQIERWHGPSARPTRSHAVRR